MDARHRPRIESGKAEPTLSELIGLMLTLGSTFEELLDPVITGGDPVDVGFKDTFPAGKFADVRSGESRILWLRTPWGAQS